MCANQQKPEVVFVFLETELMGKELDGSRSAEQLDLRAAFLLANAGRTHSCDYDLASRL